MVIQLKRKTNYTIIALISAWLILFSILIYVVSIDYFIYRIGFDGIFFLFIALFLFTGIFLLKLLLWQIRGIEKISIAEGKLILDKTGTFWTRSKIYELNNINEFRVTNKDPTPSWMRLYGIAGGKIEFEYMEITKRFGQTIENREAIQVAESLNTELKNYK